MTLDHSSLRQRSRSPVGSSQPGTLPVSDLFAACQAGEGSPPLAARVVVRASVLSSPSLPASLWRPGAGSGRNDWLGRWCCWQEDAVLWCCPACRVGSLAGGGLTHSLFVGQMPWSDFMPLCRPPPSETRWRDLIGAWRSRPPQGEACPPRVQSNEKRSIERA